MKISISTNIGGGSSMQILFSIFLTATALSSVDRKEGELRGWTGSSTGLDIGRDRGLLTSPPEAVLLEDGSEPWDMAVKDPTEAAALSEPMPYDEYIPEPDAAATFFMAPDVIQKFKAGHSLKEAEELPMQQITPSNTFEADGKMYSLDGLTPVNVFTAGATYMENGVEMSTLPEPAAFLKMEGEDMVLVSHNSQKSKMRTIDIVHADGSITYMEELAAGVVATVLPEARDRDTLKKFVMAHREIDEADESNNEWTRKLFGSAGVDTDDERKLQSGCSSFRVIEVAIAYESSYCSYMGGASNSNTAVQQIVARASTLYQNNFCSKIEISHLEGFCNSGSDPYRAGVLLNNSGCGSTGLLDFFASFWSSNRESISRDSAHLFSGTGLECSNNSCVIGCATRPSLCSSSSSYGVNYITFNNDSQMQANLFAHELAHNAGSAHDATTNSFEYIMEPSINGGSNGFSQQSRNAITNYLNSRSCIGTVPAGPTGPAPAPPAPPASAPCGCTSCTESVLTSIAGGYRCVDRINWVITTQGMPQLDACALVSDQFPSICGPGCDPNQCGSGGGGDSGEVRSVYDSTCMDVNTATSNVHTSACGGGSDQEWVYDANTQRIMTAFNPAYCLDWNLASNNLMVFPCHSGANQKWTMDGSGRIKSQLNSNACIDLHLGNANLYLNTCHTASDQRFTVPGGFF